MSCRKCTKFFECSIISELKRIRNERQKVLGKKQLRLGQNKEEITKEIIEELKVLRKEWLKARKNNENVSSEGK